MSGRKPIDSEPDQLNYPYAPKAPPPAANYPQSSPCCCWSLKVKQQQVNSFLDTPNSSRVYSVIYFVCLVFYIAYFACVVSQSNTMNGLYDKKFYFKTGQIIYGSEYEGAQNLSNLERDMPILQEEKYKKYYIPNLMEKFYSGNLLILIFTAGTALGFSPPIFIRTVSIGDGFSCISQGDANTLDNMNNFLYALSIIVFILYAFSLIYLVTNCIKINIIKFLTVLTLSIAGVICIVVSFIIVVIYSTKFVKVFYLISLVSSFLQYTSLYRQYINEKCNHPCFRDEEQQEA
ncbi:hypothetical protein ABPG72_022194 [Tetrahymena utriculariae]